MELEVLYEDNHVLVAYKPVGVLSQADITGDIDMLTMVKAYIKHRYNKPVLQFRKWYRVHFGCLQHHRSHG